MIYLDNAATTKVTEPVLNAMMPYLLGEYGNPSSIYALGRKARDAVEEARTKVAHLINAEPEEIYFTSGGSEANNWALRAGNNVISAIEHPSIMRSYFGKTVSVDEGGVVDMGALTADIESGSWEVFSIMFANNEIGTIQPIAEIGKKCRNYKKRRLLHTDAVQAFGHVPIDVKGMNIDMLSASGHKIHAPKGVGCLYIRKKTPILPLIFGGHQENGMRAGTENVASIVGFGEAAYQAEITMEERMKKTTKLRDHIWQRLYKETPNCFINGDLVNRLPGNISVTFEGISAESLVFMLDKMYGVCISAGSACSSGSITPSHVLKAIGLTDEQAQATVRISLDETLTMKEADYTVDYIKECVERLRSC